jgi:hypothetical protein
MSLYETGARRASAISWAFWLMLPDRIWRMALVMLFWRPWPSGIVSVAPTGAHLSRLSLRGCQRSLACDVAPFMYPLALRGLADRPLLNPCPMSKSGNFSVPP